MGKDWHAARLHSVRVRLVDLEKEAWRRVVDETEKPVFHQGKECGRITEYSNTLLMFLIKAEARRAEDDSSVERSDATSKGIKVEASLIVEGKPNTSHVAWRREGNRD